MKGGMWPLPTCLVAFEIQRQDLMNRGISVVEHRSHVRWRGDILHGCPKALWRNRDQANACLFCNSLQDIENLMRTSRRRSFRFLAKLVFTAPVDKPRIVPLVQTISESVCGLLDWKFGVQSEGTHARNVSLGD